MHMHTYITEGFNIFTHRIIVGTLMLGTIGTIAKSFQTTAILTTVRTLAGV